MTEAQNRAFTSLNHAAEHMKSWYDRKRRAGPEYKVGDKVMIIEHSTGASTCRFFCGYPLIKPTGTGVAGHMFFWARNPQVQVGDSEI
jgi:hypothetical protein